MTVIGPQNSRWDPASPSYPAKRLSSRKSLRESSWSWQRGIKQVCAFRKMMDICRRLDSWCSTELTDTSWKERKERKRKGNNIPCYMALVLVIKISKRLSLYNRRPLLVQLYSEQRQHSARVGREGTAVSPGGYIFYFSGFSSDAILEFGQCMLSEYCCDYCNATH